MGGLTPKVQEVEGQDEDDYHSQLLFALSSVDRMRLLRELQERGEMRLTDLSQFLKVTVQETSKHLTRLSQIGVIEKVSSGPYRVTSFGKAALQTNLSMQFLSKKRKYFSTHDVSFLPPEFVLRLGDLMDHSYVDHATNVFTECQHLLGLAREYFLWVTDQPLPWSSPKPLPGDLEVRCVIPESASMKSYRMAKEILGVKSVVRFANEVKIGMAVNERMGGLTFPDLEGRIDFNSGFIGYGPRFQKWCYDLFNLMWGSSSTKWPGGLTSKAEAEPPQSRKSG